MSIQEEMQSQSAKVLNKHLQKKPDAVVVLSISNGNIDVDHSHMPFSDLCLLHKLLDIEITGLLKGLESRIITK